MIVTKTKPRSEIVSGPLSLTDRIVSVPPGAITKIWRLPNAYIIFTMNGVGSYQPSFLSKGIQKSAHGKLQLSLLLTNDEEAGNLSQYSNGLWAGWPGFNCGQV
jgi:hypothetical protein